MYKILKGSILPSAEAPEEEKIQSSNDVTVERNLRSVHKGHPINGALAVGSHVIRKTKPFIAGEVKKIDYCYYDHAVNTRLDPPLIRNVWVSFNNKPDTPYEVDDLMQVFLN